MVGNFIAVMMAKTVQWGVNAMQHHEAVAVGFHSSVLMFTVARDICGWCDFQDHHSCFMQMQLILREM